jgi:hypothetical protein
MFSSESIGFGSSCYKGTCKAHASAASLSVMFSLSLIVFLMTYTRASTEITTLNASLWRRLCALALDMIVLIYSILTMLTMPIIITEFLYTGSFLWEFKRDFQRPIDTFFLNYVIYTLTIIPLFYFYWSIRQSKQTLGQYICNYKVVPIDKKVTRMNAISRIFLGVLGICLFPISIPLGIFNNSKFWWDSGSKTIAKVVSKT